MTSITYLPVVAAALVLAAFAQPASATEPHSSSRIGTGSGHGQPRTASGAPTSAHWSAGIGAGLSSPVASSTGGVSVSAHWSARIGTGKATEQQAPSQVDRAQTLGEHPAVLVARSWNNRSIDPNTFIVRHPAGPAWVDPSATAVTIASVSN